MNINVAYEVEKLPGMVEVERCRVEKVDAGEGKMKPQIVREMVKVPAGWLVSFPNGHSIRVFTERRLKELGFDTPAPIIDLESGDTVMAKMPSLKARAKV